MRRMPPKHRKWVIADLHFRHPGILSFSNGLRGGTTMEEHDKWIIDQWNSVVTKHDLVYVLGDVAINSDGLDLVKKLRGSKMLVRGNHDIYDTRRYLDVGFQQVHGIIRYRGTFWLTHVPIHPGSLRHLYNIHGHTHQNIVPGQHYICCSVEHSFGVPQSLDMLAETYGPLVKAAYEQDIQQTMRGGTSAPQVAAKPKDL